MTKVLSLVVLSLALLAGCSKSSENLTSARKDGWTDEVYTASFEACRDTLQDALKNQKNVRPVCTCYTDGLSTKFTLEELDKGDENTEKLSENLLASCALQNNETIVYGIARFLRVPNEETPVPNTVKKTLGKVKKSDPHVFPLKKEDSGLVDPRQDPLPPPPAEVPRPPAPPTAKPEAAPAPVLPKQVEIKLAEPVVKSRKGPQDLKLPKVSCSIADGGLLSIQFDAEETTKEKDVLVLAIPGFDSEKHHYSGVAVEAVLTKASDGYDYVYNSRKKGEAINLTLKDGMLTGALNFPKLFEELEGGPMRGVPAAILSVLGEFSCKVKDDRKPVAK